MTRTDPARITANEWAEPVRRHWERSGRPSGSFEAWMRQQLARPELDPAVELERDRKQLRRERMERVVPARYRDAEVSTPAVAVWCDRVLAQAEDMRGPSLLLLGPTGTGKTHAGYTAVRRLILAGYRGTVAALTSADLFGMLRPRSGVDSEERMETLCRAAVLMVDDLGSAKGSEWTEEVTFRLINARYNAELPTLFTSNVPTRELAEILGGRVASRLVEMCQTVVLRGEDRRIP